MQVPAKSDVAALLRRLVARELPSGSGLEAWDSFLRAHATLMRRLEVDLAQATGLALADFDVLAQLARAGGELRMTDLASRVLVSRSGMTRRVARLVRGVSELFVAQLDEQELAVLRNALNKVTVDCTFG